MGEIILWIYLCVGMLTFASLYGAAAVLLWRLVLKDIVEHIRNME